MAIDTHSHIFDEAFDLDRDEVIKRIIENNIEKIMLVGFSKTTNKLALELANKHSFIYPTVGYHPSEANEIGETDLVELAELIANNKVYAIGECGLDYYWVKDNKETQKWLFKAQIELSIKFNLPLVIHCRDAINDVYEIL
jgi:TatD DNase family protein